MMVNAKNNPPSSSSSSKDKGRAASPPPKATPTTGGGGWSNGLLVYIRQPDKHPESVYYHDNDLVVIYEKYPKAKYHFLVMPKKIIPSIDKLSESDLDLLELIEERSKKIVAKLKEKNPSLSFKLGFHAVPSMTQLHAHLISQDFASESMKTKKHWNSFTTDYFIPIKQMKSIISNHGYAKLPKSKSEYEALLKNPMKCNRCHQECSNIPLLKKHIEQCDG
eukprot:TRINITY_DN4143_c0_g2_i1.p1 TRINITY_DN4143_c0_g2~~TRINITY_DN4143_c0_g2_i1.p1  ORF type:complete len:221 (-),score=58.17 TRINITY_DN4143_c0_g2_i1:76-738(-)